MALHSVSYLPINQLVRGDIASIDIFGGVSSIPTEGMSVQDTVQNKKYI